eukprot:1025794-Pleurochrysis_carterae.AAC.1
MQTEQYCIREWLFAFARRSNEHSSGSFTRSSLFSDFSCDNFDASQVPSASTGPVILRDTSYAFVDAYAQHVHTH